VLASGIHKLLNFFVRNHIIPFTGRSIDIISVVVDLCFLLLGLLSLLIAIDRLSHFLRSHRVVLRLLLLLLELLSGFLLTGLC